MAKFWATWKLRLLAGVAILAALAIAVFASYHIGKNNGTHIADQRISQYEIDLSNLQKKLVDAQGKITTKIVTEYKDRIITQTKIEYVNRDIIHNVVTSRPVENTLSNGWIYAHNQSAAGLPIDPALAADQRPSGIPDNIALSAINDNYGVDHRNAAKLEALQDWIRQTQEAAKNAKK